MADARLLAVEVERFKSYKVATRAELAPLTVILGRNNSGKSTLIQALLLLKQTLAHPRSDVPINLEGLVDALSLRELAFGGHRAPADAKLEMPTIAVTWQSRIDVDMAAQQAGFSALFESPQWHPGGDPAWLRSLLEGDLEPRTTLRIHFSEYKQRAGIEQIELVSEFSEHQVRAHVRRSKSHWIFAWEGTTVEQVDVEFDHFLPYLSIDRSDLHPRSQDPNRVFYNLFLLLFAQPIEEFKQLIHELQYLGSTRAIPPPLYRPASVPPEEIGVSGEYAAQLIQARQHETVHFLPPLDLDADGLSIPEAVRARSLANGVNEVMTSLGIDTTLSVREIQNVGFQLLFGGASLVHVGRGLTHLLPVVELGLLADPLRFEGDTEDMSLDTYRERCDRYVHVALEEPEAHLHPKVQSRLAHWLVALAMANRQIIVETHSDHLVRRLRGLIARAKAGSDLEVWLRENVVILEVDQQDGESTVTPVRLTQEGGLGERWPADFMDEASEEESAIYYAALDKSGQEAVGDSNVVHDEGPEPEGDEP